jgi:hypothetical protein
VLDQELRRCKWCWQWRPAVGFIRQPGRTYGVCAQCAEQRKLAEAKRAARERKRASGQTQG